MNYCNVLFDLDGTLTDPYLGITNSVKYALGKFEIIEENVEKLKSFIGPPLDKSFIEYYGFDKDTSKKAVEYYREYYSLKGIYENKLYKDVKNVLKHLENKNCIIATSKLKKFAIEIIHNFKINNYFKYIVGGNLDGTLSEKDEIIKYILEEYKLNKTETIMVGDRKYDIIGANRNGIDSVGVMYGYGSQKELEESKATYYCKNVTDLINIL
jgi:phosphoglycolate phosphatase